MKRKRPRKGSKRRNKVKEFKKQKVSEDVFEREVKVKKLYEEMRVNIKNTFNTPEKIALIDSLLELIGDNVLQYCKKHDMSLVIQAIIHYGTKSHRNTVLEFLKGNIIELTQNEYGNFVMLRFLKHGDKEHKAVLYRELSGQIFKLTRHKRAAEVIETAYVKSTNKQKAMLVAEFYGPSYSLSHEGERLDKVFEKEPELKPLVLKHLKETVAKILDKEMLHLSVMHKIMWEYLKYAPITEAKELILALAAAAPLMVHTKFGHKVVNYCISYGSAKIRKIIVRGLRDHIAEIAFDGYGHLVLLRCLNCIDDTTILKKFIVGKMMADRDSAMDMMKHRYARFVWLQLIAPLSKTYFPENVLEMLAPTFIEKNGKMTNTCKKPQDIREKQLWKATAPFMIELLENPANMRRLLFDTHFSVGIVEETLFKVEDEVRQRLYDVLLGLFKSEHSMAPDSKLIYNASVIRFLKRLAKKDDAFGILFLQKLQPLFKDWFAEDVTGAVRVLVFLAKHPKHSKKACSILKSITASLTSSQKSQPNVAILIKQL